MEITSEVIYDKDFLTIFLKPELKQIHLKWKGYAASDQFRDGLNAALKLVKERKLEYWLGDLKLMQLILPFDEEWTTNMWFPLIATTSLKKMAIVTSLDFLNNSAVKRMVNATAPLNTIETRFFVDASEAMAWLEQDF